MNTYQDWRAKSEIAYSLRVHFCKNTVWHIHLFGILDFRNSRYHRFISWTTVIISIEDCNNKSHSNSMQSLKPRPFKFRSLYRPTSERRYLQQTLAIYISFNQWNDIRLVCYSVIGWERCRKSKFRRTIIRLYVGVTVGT